jgi:hypothetical protein
MKKIVPILLFLCSFAFSVMGQSTPTVLVKVVTTETATTIKADIVVFSKDSIVGFQLPIRWNSAAVAKPKSIESQVLSNFTAGSYSIENDYATVVWITPTGSKDGQYLNGKIILSAVFTKIKDGNPNIRVVEDPIPIEFVGLKNKILVHKALGTWDNPYPIKGRVFADMNQDCVINTGDNPFMNIAVKASHPSEGDFYGHTDVDGSFKIYTTNPTLPYTVSIVRKDTLLWSPCVTNIVTTPQKDSLIQFDFAIKAKKLCIESDVKVSIPFLRRCFSNTYTIRYQNTGTLTMLDAYILLTLDKDLIMESVSLPYTALGNQQFKVELGDLPIGANGVFYLAAKLNCATTTLGQTHCVEAQFFPENNCNNGASKISIKPTCTNGKVNFEIENKNILAESDITYLIIEDDMIFKQGNIPNFSPSQIINKDVPANGAVWRMEIRKNNILLASNFYEACGTNAQGKISTGFPIQYPQAKTATNIDKNCQQSIGAYDPNDKQGFPTGVTSKHYLDENTDIEYLIRFQNTGTDTAFNVMIEDRIDENLLDLSKIRILSSSHKMDWSIKNKNTLIFDFKNIMLVDSFKNEKLSHGFVLFSIAQKYNNPLQSVIKNKASIYFDFNEPIITNETFHTIGRDFLSINTENIFIPEVSIVLKPNPFSTQASMEIIGNIGGELRLEVLDLFGRKIHEQATDNARFEMNKNNYQEGLYLYQIYKGQQLIANGKFVVQ